MHRVISNLKSWLQGTHCGVSGERLQVYLDVRRRGLATKSAITSLTRDSTADNVFSVIEWRLQACMAEAGIRFATDLHRRLREVLGGDASPSKAHVSRLVRTPPERLNLATLDGLCVALDYTPGGLLRYRPS